MRNLLRSVGELLLLVLFFLLFLAGSVRGCFARPQTAERALKIQGYRDVAITDHAWFAVGLRGCDMNDAARFTATALNPRGEKVELFVCTGWPLKGATIRTK